NGELGLQADGGKLEAGFLDAAFRSLLPTRRMSHGLVSPPMRVASRSRIAFGACVARDRYDVGQVDVQVIVRAAVVGSVRSDPDGGKPFALDTRVPLDPLAGLEEVVTNAVN